MTLSSVFLSRQKLIGDNSVLFVCLRCWLVNLCFGYVMLATSAGILLSMMQGGRTLVVNIWFPISHIFWITFGSIYVWFHFKLTTTLLGRNRYINVLHICLLELRKEICPNHFSYLDEKESFLLIQYKILSQNHHPAFYK